MRNKFRTLLAITLILCSVCLPHVKESPKNEREQTPKKASNQKNEFYSVTEFEKYLKDQKPATLADAIGGLPVNVRKHYVLGLKSSSSQKGKKGAPRVIFFEPNGNFFAGFHGTSKSLEIIQIDPKTGKPSFFEAVEENNRVVLNANPTSCAECHARGNLKENRLLWEPYHTWPGFAGSFADVVEKGEAAEEVEDFVNSMKGESRYRHLVDLEQNFGKKGQLNVTKGTVYGPEMNFQMTATIMQANVKYIAHQITEHPKYKDVRNKLIRELTKDSVGPEDVRQLVNGVYGNYFGAADWSPSFHNRSATLPSDAFYDGASWARAQLLYALAKTDKSLEPLLEGLNVDDNYSGKGFRIIKPRFHVDWEPILRKADVK